MIEPERLLDAVRQFDERSSEACRSFCEHHSATRFLSDISEAASDIAEKFGIRANLLDHAWRAYVERR